VAAKPGRLGGATINFWQIEGAREVDHILLLRNAQTIESHDNRAPEHSVSECPFGGIALRISTMELRLPSNLAGYWHAQHRGNI